MTLPAVSNGSEESTTSRRVRSLSGEKRVLVVTDGTGAVQALADRIAGAAGDCKVSVKTAAAFTAVDILPADVCFFGCEEPAPPSFFHLEEVLRHINLIGRSCGLFSPASGEAAAYLSALVLDSEISVPQPPFVSSFAGDIGVWAESIIEWKGTCHAKFRS